jgi:hypothetical protein
MPADAPLNDLSTEQLQKLRNDLKAQRRAQVKAGKPLPLYENATTSDVIRMAGELEDHLLAFKTVVGQWLINMDRMGAEKVSQPSRPRLAPDRPDPR